MSYRLVGRLPKFSSIIVYMCDVLRWLPIISVDTVSYHCDGLPLCPSMGPSYLCDQCQSWQCWLGSAARGELFVLRVRLAIMQQRTFLIVGPSALNDIPFELRSPQMAHPSKLILHLSEVLLLWS